MTIFLVSTLVSARLACHGISDSAPRGAYHAPADLSSLSQIFGSHRCLSLTFLILAHLSWMSCGLSAEDAKSAPAPQIAGPTPSSPGVLAPGEVAANELEETNTGLVVHAGQPFTGASVAFYANGRKKYRTEYIRGQRHGASVAWHDNGRQSIVAQFIDGQRQGEEIRRDRSGTIRMKTAFVDNVPDGEQWYFYDSSQPQKVYTWRQGGIDGPFREWYPNGALHVDGSYLGQEACGEWFHFTDDGRFVLYRTFTRDFTADPPSFVEDAERLPSDPALQERAEKIFQAHQQ
jgi:antitoxin component YwqK of YwqJK toxin-antitoxin module